MPVKEKSRHRASMIGMPKRKNEKKGCRRRRKAGIEQARSACQKEKIEKKDAEEGEKPAYSKRDRHAKKKK